MTRNVKTAKTFTRTPEDPKVRSVLEEVAQYPELTLSRREIIKYILVEAGERSKEIQALLKLDDIGNIRSVLQTAKNKLTAAHSAAQKDLSSAEDALRRHLDAKKLSNEDILAAVNPQRKILGLPEIAEFTADTLLNAGVLEGGGQPVFNKASALRDVATVSDAAGGLTGLGKTEVAALMKDIGLLEADPVLLTKQAVAIAVFSLLLAGTALKKPDGSVENWAFEAGTPSVLFRRGLHEEFTGYGSRRRRIPGQGWIEANGRGVTFPDGRRLFLGSSGTGTPYELTP